MSTKVSTYSGKVQPGILDILPIDRDGNILVLDDRIAASRLVSKHVVIFLAVNIERITHHAKQYPVFEIQHVQPSVIDGDLGSTSGIERVQKF